jgi:hypothetical protein
VPLQQGAQQSYSYSPQVHAHYQHTHTFVAGKFLNVMGIAANSDKGNCEASFAILFRLQARSCECECLSGRCTLDHTHGGTLSPHAAFEWSAGEYRAQSRAFCFCAFMNPVVAFLMNCTSLSGRQIASMLLTSSVVVSGIEVFPPFYLKRSRSESNR